MKTFKVPVVRRMYSPQGNESVNNLLIMNEKGVYYQNNHTIIVFKKRHFCSIFK